MAKEDLLEFDGTVTEVLPDGNFRVTLDNEHELLAYMSGKMRKFRIRTGVGDRVVIEVSPYDLNRGRINFRHKDTERVAGARPPGGRISAGARAIAPVPGAGSIARRLLRIDRAPIARRG